MRYRDHRDAEGAEVVRNGMISQVLDTLAQQRPIFHAEADFQHAVAWRIHALFPAAKVRLEYPVALDDGMIYVDDISYIKGAPHNELGVKIHSGRNRIVRRIFEHLGYDVIKLDRVMFAGLTKKGLERGHWRYLKDKEVDFLKMI